MKKTAVPQVVRWVARGLSMLAAGFVLVMFFGEGGGPSLLFRHPEILWALFPVLGLTLAWVWELPGSLLVLAWLAAFYMWNYAANGQFPRGPWFALIASPAIPFLLAWFLTRTQRHASAE